MKRKLLYVTLICLFLICLSTACQLFEEPKPEPEDTPEPQNLTEEKPVEPVEEVASPEIGDGPEKDHRELSMENIVKIYGDTIFRFGSRSEKTVALTFDDGPDNEFTSQILDMLKRFDVKATFFITGVRAVENLAVLKRIDAEGHELGHHGFHHYKMSNLTPEKILEELDELNKLFMETTGKSSYIFRPPYGAIDAELVETVRDAGFYIVLWDIDSLDWRSLPTAEVLTNIVPNIHPGAIILQHAAGGPGENLSGTVEALAEFIPTLLEEGYRFVTISELLQEKMVARQLNP